MRILILFVIATSLVADGGGVVAQKTVNHFRVTVFANPLPMSIGQEQIAVLIESQRASVPLPHTRVWIRAASPEHGMDELELTKSSMREGSYTVTQQLRAAGTWKFEVVVGCAGVRGDIPVEATVNDAVGQIGTFAPLIAVAPAGAILFVFNRVLRAHSARTGQA